METEATEVAAEMPPPSAGRTNVVMPKDPTTVYFTNTLFGTAPVPPHSPFPSLPAPADKPSGNLSAQYDNPHFFALPFTLSMTPHPPLNLINQHFGWATPKTMAWDPHTAILRGDPFHMRCEYSCDAICQRGRLMLGMNVTITRGRFPTFY